MRESLSTYLLHAHIISSIVVTVLVEFYCDRLTDQACVPELLKGLLALSKFDKFTGADCVKAVKAYARKDVLRCLLLGEIVQIIRN